MTTAGTSGLFLPHVLARQLKECLQKTLERQQKTESSLGYILGGGGWWGIYICYYLPCPRGCGEIDKTITFGINTKLYLCATHMEIR